MTKKTNYKIKISGWYTDCFFCPNAPVFTIAGFRKWQNGVESKTDKQIPICEYCFKTLKTNISKSRL